jgi:hypothetical protein
MNSLNYIPPIAMAGTMIALTEDVKEEDRLLLEEKALLIVQDTRILVNHTYGLPKSKRTYIGYNQERARASVETDYFGPSPIIQDHHFARFF